MAFGWFITASDIKNWTETNKRRAEELLPLLIRKLIQASCKPDHLHFPVGDSVSVGGMDGTLKVDEGNEFIPTGKSVWEFGTNRSVKTKADSDYYKRTDNPGNINPSEATFVFVTSRTWQSKDEWCFKKNSEGIWQQVNGINADDLETWLQQCLGVHRWFSNLIGKRTESLWDIEQAWRSWAHSTSIPATFDLVLNGRVGQLEELVSSLKGEPAIVRITASSENEAYAFGLATMVQNEELASKVLIVKSQKQWDILLDTQNTLILLPLGFIPENIGYARKKGHFPVIPTDSNAPQTASKTTLLEKMSRDDVINALQSMGLSEEQAKEIYSDTRGYLGPIRRHKILGPQENIVPEWADHFDSNILVTALLATEWDNRKEKDKEAISNLAAVTYEKLEEKLLEVASTAEPPVRLVGNVWQVVSKIDLWSLIAHKINKQHIERLEPIVFTVLGEKDPSYDLDAKDRWMANIKGVIPNYSNYLKSGLADTIAILAIFGDSICQNLGEVKLADRVAYWVRELLKKDITARGWYSLGSNLIPLAEASPESFLEALETSIQGENPPITPIFNEGGDFGSCPHSYLLWALETISWNLDYLPRVTLVLARLSEIDPDGRYINRPINSLREIYLGWINNTMASHEERLQIIDANLVKFFPDIAWRLLFKLLPERTGEISHPIHKPDYRDWANQVNKTDTKRFYKYVEELANRLLNMVNEKPQTRWPELVDHITQIPTKRQFHIAIDKLLSINLDNIIEIVRLNIADKLRNTISSHREFKNTNWALPKEDIDRLEEAFNFIVPENPILKYKYLFDNHLPSLINPIFRKEIDYKEQIEIIVKHRQDALKEIYQKTGIDGIQQIASACTSPESIGYAIAYSELRSFLENDFLSWLDNKNERLILVSQSFISACANIDKGWVDSVLKESDAWSKDKLTNFLLGLPFGQDTFVILSNTDEKVNERYWKKNRNYFLKESDIKKINWVMGNFLLNGRPLTAIHAASQVLHSSRSRVFLDCNLLSNILKKIAIDPSDKDQIPISLVRHVILLAIKYLQDQEELSKDEIIQIEWMYLDIFRFESVKPKYLEDEITKNPAFFAQLITWIFKSDEGKREEIKEDIDKKSLKLRAENAWKLLSIISIIPGQQEDGSIDTNKLREWVLNAREQLDHLDRKKIGDKQIGKVLSNSLPGTDGIWPHEAVRDIIEEIKSPEIEKALMGGRINSRGVTTRSLFEGGVQEQEFAKKYGDQAQAIKLKWPRTSEILRRLGRSYNREATREDQQVELEE